MKCKICGSSTTTVIYDDYIRDGAVETLTDKKYKMYQCGECGCIWHDIDKLENIDFYQSEKYRLSLEHNSGIENYYALHDKEVLEKLQYTGTDIYRNKIVADIGCGGGSFLDFIKGAVSESIGVEPSKLYREHLSRKGHKAFAYASEACEKYEGLVDVAVSFDVIEHVDNPVEFLQNMYTLMKKGGYAIIGTPSEAPVMRQLLGKVYEQRLLYSFQHPWILSEKSFKLVCEQAGFSDIRIEQRQRYGLGNLISWILNKKPEGQISYEFISDTLNETYIGEIEEAGLADYLIAYLRK